MPKRTQYFTKVKQLLTAVYAQQKVGGNFESASFPHRGAGPIFSYQTTFFTSQILLALQFCPDSQLKTKVQEKALSFLLDQKSTAETWNYWSRESSAMQKMPYPDDADDTFCALIALYVYQPERITGQVLAKVVCALTALEEKVGGPYRTWFVNGKEKEWRDVDVVVNSNIARFLAFFDVDLEGLEEFLTDSVKTRKLTSPYYSSTIVIGFFLASGFIVRHPELKLVFVRWLRQKWHQEKHKHPVPLALYIRTLVLLDAWASHDEVWLKKLDKCSLSEIKQPFGFCFDPTREGQKYVASSPALNLVLVAAALSDVDAFSQKRQKIEQNLLFRSEKELKEFAANLQVSLFRRLKPLPPLLRSLAKSQLEVLLAQDTDYQIQLLSFFFAISLKPRQHQKISSQLIHQLAEANVLGWVAYSIYDDFWDGEGQVPQLSVANFCLREMSQIFTTVSIRVTGFTSIYQQIMADLDAANIWEVEHCRVIVKGSRLQFPTKWPNFGQLHTLAEKSFGHLLGPLAILSSLGYTSTSKPFQQFLLFGRSLLIARQLNDDAHDWEDDLTTGRVTPVIALLLKKYVKKYGVVVEIKLGKRSMMQFRTLMWKEVMQEVADMILDHCDAARSALSECVFFADTSIFEKLITKNEGAARLAKKEQERVSEFLSNYT